MSAFIQQGSALYINRLLPFNIGIITTYWNPLISEAPKLCFPSALPLSLDEMWKNLHNGN